MMLSWQQAIFISRYLHPLNGKKQLKRNDHHFYTKFKALRLHAKLIGETLFIETKNYSVKELTLNMTYGTKYCFQTVFI